MAQTHLAQGQASAAASRQPPLALLLGGLEWGLLLAALGLWAGSRSYSPVMSYGSGLLVASWLVRWLRTGRLARATSLDWLIGLFMLSVLVGLWAAPSLSLALPRLYLFLGALGLFYALANSEGASLRRAALGLVLVSATIGLYFVTQHNWAQESVKFDAIRALGLWLNGLVPDLGQYKPHPNVVASILGIALPVAVALLIESARAWRASRAAQTAAVAAGLALLVIGLVVVMTESRAVWLALAGALSLAIWWWLAGRLSRSRPGLGWRPAVFWIGVGLGTVVVLAVLAARPGLLTLALGTLPGPTNSATNRLELFSQVWRLAQDTAFTGGGLAAFPALYSTYVLDIPVLLLTHAHNAYLNVLIEQGWPGLAAYALVLAGGAWAATRCLAQPAGENRALLAAGAAGLAVVTFQGLGDGTLVASRAIPFLFVPAGLVMAALPPTDAAPAPAPYRRTLILGGALLSVILLVLVWARQPLEAAWYANQGAVTYARIELARWPTGQWNTRSLAPALAAANPAFQRALALDAAQRTAHHRLGLEARLAQDFARAADHLEQAAAADPDHRGITKPLAYTYVWLGDFDAARPLLRQVPEARDEMKVYEWWWGQQERQDLAANALRMFRELAP